MRPLPHALVVAVATFAGAPDALPGPRATEFFASQAPIRVTGTQLRESVGAAVHPRFDGFLVGAPGFDIANSPDHGRVLRLPYSETFAVGSVPRMQMGGALVGIDDYAFGALSGALFPSAPSCAQWSFFGSDTVLGQPRLWGTIPGAPCLGAFSTSASGYVDSHGWRFIAANETSVRVFNAVTMDQLPFVLRRDDAPPIASGGWGADAIAIDDLNADGAKEIMVASGFAATVYDGATGEIIRSFPVKVSGGNSEIVRMTLIDDLTGDGVREVAGAWRLRAVVAIDPVTGALVWTSPVQSQPQGVAIANIGDFDADGVADIAAGSPSPSDLGHVYVYSGRTGELLRTYVAEQAGDHFGAAVAGGADVNHDGLPDLAVGAPTFDIGGLFDVGRAYVFYQPRETCPDVNGDGRIDSADIDIIRMLWGVYDVDADVNADGLVNANDLAIVLARYGAVCP